MRRVLLPALLLLFGTPWWTVVYQPGWPVAGFVVGTVLFALGFVGLPLGMFLGHGRGQDVVARLADTLIGIIWVLFVWCIPADVALGVLAVSGVDGSARKVVALAALALVLVLLAWANVEARRVPRVRRTEITLPGLGAGLDGLRVAVLTDTHYGPINRTRWSQRLVAATNALEPDVACHVGDLADGPVARRHGQVAPLGAVTAPLGRFYVTGNHEYFGEAQAWLDHMAELGWQPLHNRRAEVERDGATLVFAGIDDPTGANSRAPGHGPDLATALADAPEAPVVLLAHQPRQVAQAVEAGVALQLSGHTHGGQIWPFHYLVRIDQPVLQGLSRHGGTQLYTSRGSGFWGPPFRLFAPSEISLLTLRSG
jgi:predicted MPP superfamily phosphohydrolase